MNENFFDKEIRSGLMQDLETGNISEAGDSSKFFLGLMQNFPVVGSKIDWAKVPNSVERFEGDIAIQSDAYVLFFKDMAEGFFLEDDVFYVGDSAPIFAIKGKIQAIERILPILLEIPQHHYFIGPKYSWCLSLTMEGWMGFGFGGQQKSAEIPSVALCSKTAKPRDR